MANLQLHPSEALQQQWRMEQDTLKAHLVLEDRLSASMDDLQFVGGVDISFIKGDSVNACASLVVLELPTLKVRPSEMCPLREHDR